MSLVVFQTYLLVISQCYSPNQISIIDPIWQTGQNESIESNQEKSSATWCTQSIGPKMSRKFDLITLLTAEDFWFFCNLYLQFIEGVMKKSRLTNCRFTTISSQISAIYTNIFHKTEVQTVILRC